MIRLTQTGVGKTSNVERPVYDSTGTGVLPMQANVEGTATFDILGRVAPEAPWVPLKTGLTEGFLENFSWLPYVQLSVTAGDGTVNIWVGEK